MALSPVSIFSTFVIVSALARADAHSAHASSTSSDVDRLKPSVAAHGWFMTLAWAVCIPVAVLAVRYGKVHLEECSRGNSTDSAVTSANMWLRSNARWFQIHLALNSIGLVCALVGFILIYLEANVGGEHFTSKHSVIGMATLVLGFLQPLNACFRPSTPIQGVNKTFSRSAWEIYHRTSGAIAFLCSIAAVISGLEVAVTWGLTTDDALKTKVVYIVWLVTLCIITIVFEIRRWRGC
jgi:hypothetical protein